MGIWIRSQCGLRLIECDNFNVSPRTRIITERYKDIFIVLGEYKTPERTFEVLNEIMKHIDDFENQKLNAYYYNGADFPNSYPNYYLYQMPKE